MRIFELNGIIVEQLKFNKFSTDAINIDEI